MPGRKYNTGNYRFGFNGKENDREWGNQLIQDYGFRLYNPAIGKFLSVDPLAPEYPWYTPYQFAGNKPIWAIDLDGLEEEFSTEEWRLRMRENYPQTPRVVESLDYAFSWMNRRPLTTRNMGRYIEGQGGYHIVSINEIRNFSQMDFALWTVERLARSELTSQIDARISNGGEVSGEYRTREFSGVGSFAALNDLGSAFGGAQLNLHAIINVDYNKKSGSYTYSGTYYYTFSDVYLWRPGTKSFFNHELMDRLRTEGNAETFWTRAYFEQDVAGASFGWSVFHTIGEDYNDSSNLNNHTELPPREFNPPAFLYGMPAEVLATDPITDTRDQEINLNRP